MESLANQFNKSQLINEFKAVIADAEALLKATANTSGEKLLRCDPKQKNHWALQKPS